MEVNRKMVEKKCLICDKMFKPRKCYGKVSKFCSRFCHAESQRRGDYPHVGYQKGSGRGMKNSQWKGGKHEIHGYILVFSKIHPNCDNGGYVRAHRIVAELWLDRYLSGVEVVHHDNGDKADNRPQNLVVFPDQKSHIKYHNLKKSIYPEGVIHIKDFMNQPHIRMGMCGT